MSEWNIPREYLDQSREIERLKARVAELEAIICVYADPTGAPQDDHDLIMSCHDWWKEEQQALKGQDDGS